MRKLAEEDKERPKRKNSSRRDDDEEGEEPEVLWPEGPPWYISYPGAALGALTGATLLGAIASGASGEGPTGRVLAAGGGLGIIAARMLLNAIGNMRVNRKKRNAILDGESWI